MLAKYIREANAACRRTRRHMPLGPLRTEAESHRAVATLNEIIDEIGEQESHALGDLAETLPFAIAAYAEIHVLVQDASGPAVLRTLMDEQGLAQSNLTEIGSQGVVSEILSGKRDLNVRQIAGLAARFSVSPAVFLPTLTRAGQWSRKKAGLSLEEK